MKAITTYLSGYRHPYTQGALSIGECVGKWRITARIGQSQQYEIYRVVACDSSHHSAALKLCVAIEPAVVQRFQKEVHFLKETTLAVVPHYYEEGTIAMRPYCVMELLEPIELPQRATAIARYLIQVCRAVGQLHQAGYIHQDLKPTNIMERPQTHEIVLIDFEFIQKRSMGIAALLVKDVSGAGTLGYAAPEQIVGDPLSIRTDIHALGCFIDTCFEGHPPACWVPILQQATSSLPNYRYASTNAFIKAIHCRHWRTTHSILVSTLVVVAIVGLCLTLRT